MKGILFKYFAGLISDAAQYNAKIRGIEIDNTKLKKSLKLVSNSLSEPESEFITNKIQYICVKLLHEKSLAKNANLHSFTCAFDAFDSASYDLLNQLESCNYLGKASELKSDIEKMLGLVDQDVAYTVQASTAAVLKAIQQDDLTVITNAFHLLDEASRDLTFYAKNIKVPAWFGRVIEQQTNNTLVARANREGIEKIKGKIGAADADAKAQANDLKKAIEECDRKAVEVEQTMADNNNLLSKIEEEVNAAKYAVEQIKQSLNELKPAAVEGRVLRCLQEKTSVAKLNELRSAIKNLPDYFDSSAKIDTYIERFTEIKDHYLSSCLNTITWANTILGTEQEITKDFKAVLKNVTAMQHSLNEWKLDVINNKSSPLSSDSLVYERSFWQWMQYSVAKMIGVKRYEKYFGDLDGVEILRQLVEGLNDEQSELIFKSLPSSAELQMYAENI